LSPLGNYIENFLNIMRLNNTNPLDVVEIFIFSMTSATPKSFV
jgi:hypothetical protein